MAKILIYLYRTRLKPENMKSIKVKYKADGLTIIWQPDICVHAGICVRMLPTVYHPTERPWVTPQFATKEQLIKQIDACPSKALSYELDK